MILLKKFAASVKSRKTSSAIVHADCLAHFNKWLRNEGLSDKTIGSAHNLVASLLRWCVRNAPRAIAKNVNIWSTPHAAGLGQPLEARSSPNADQIKRILAACYSDIEGIENRIFEERMLPLSPEAGEYKDLLMFVLKSGEGMLPSQEALRKVRGGTSALVQLKKYGGLMGVIARYYLTHADVFPFYLAILIQTSGNPQSILKMGRDCIVGVPLRPDLERLVWEKRRAGREQAPEFPRSKEWSAPNIVRKLLALTDELVPQASTFHRESVFLCRSLRLAARCLSWQSIHLEYQDFLKRHGLPHFELRQYRTAGAVLHNQAAKTIEASRIRLQHADVQTTRSYTAQSDVQGFHDGVILKFQGLIRAAAQQYGVRRTTPGQTVSTDSLSTTVFGFDCSSPLAGTAPGSKKGELCLSFSQCATCPGAIVVVDDPVVVARLVTTRDHLVKTRERSLREGWSPRFDAIYGPTLAILEHQVLPFVAPETFRLVQGVGIPSLPHLE
ncbi:hypothetical protein [uncultured Ramlibacter sp.]|mgnify:CR=1 FL=1|uniref:hypothetical protein n=1 Tax=uncultured Ramlibacter sp. TaxID=260755 RepID=UPI0026196E8F|nr:hypothetical protein [uncultured Ramlibacter sp.]